MFKKAYQRAFNIILKKPFTLWGLSLLSILLATLATILSGPVLGLGIAISYVLAAGMAKIYLDGLDEKDVNSDQLFSGFKSFFHVAGGMAWKDLWIFIWCLIPIVGPFFAIYKAYQYSFVPYILMEQPEVSATEALRLSMKKTNGKKADMFLADFLYSVIIFAVFLILGLLSNIPYIGVLFAIIMFAAFVVVFCFSGLFTGLYKAYFYKIPDVVITYAEPVNPAQINDGSDNTATE